jgi:hypothetical protein
MTFTTLSLEAATKRFDLHNFSFAYDRNNRNSVVKIAETAAVLSELRLDLVPNDNTIAYVFMENLTVSGTIWNEQTDSGIALIALKNVSAKNIAVGGQEIYIAGNLEVEELICGSNNQGTMTVRGDVKAQYILNDDYIFQFEQAVDAIVLNDIKIGYYKINNWKESLDNSTLAGSNLQYWNIFNPSVYDVLNGCFDFPALIKILNKGDKLFMDNEEKFKQLDFKLELFVDLFFKALDLKNDVHIFGFGLKKIDLNFVFIYQKELESFYLQIKARNEVFNYTLKDGIFTVNVVTANSYSFTLNTQSDPQRYYRAMCLLIKTQTIVDEFMGKRNRILNLTKDLLPDEFPELYPSVKRLYSNPVDFYTDNQDYFDNLKIDYTHWSFQKHALLTIFKQTHIALVFHGEEYNSEALNELVIKFKQHGFDIETDWKARGLYLKRRLEYFYKDVLIVNTICKEKNIPLSILDFSVWLNERFIVFFAVKNEDKDMLLNWLNELEF